MTEPTCTPHPTTRLAIEDWRRDPEVQGIVWVGSRSRGYGDAGSDDDLELLLHPEAFARVAPADSYLEARDPDAVPPRLIHEAQLTCLAVLQAKAESARDLDRWPYEGAQVLFDRDGQVGPAVAAAARMAPEFRRARLMHGAMDAWLAVTRARKTSARGHQAAAHAVVARGAKALSRVLFALEGRWAPLDHWLEPEVASLRDEAQAGPLLLEALRSMGPEPIAEALGRLQGALAAEGFPPPEGFGAFVSQLNHPKHALERALHGLN